MNTPVAAERLASFKQNLSGLTFAIVRTVNARDEDIMSFESKGGFTTYDYDPSFVGDKNEFTTDEWRTAKKSYRRYYGFAEDSRGRHIYFNMKGHKWQSSDSNMTQLGIAEMQTPCTPPLREAWMVGRLGPKELSSKGPWFKSWAVCTRQESLFADIMRGVRLPDEKLIEALRLTCGVNDDRLILLVKIICQSDLEYLLALRRTNTMQTDYSVKIACMHYAPQFWEQYVTAVMEQRSYSSVIPAPAPKVIEDNLTGHHTEAVGLNTPFAGLKI